MVIQRRQSAFCQEILEAGIAAQRFETWFDSKPRRFNSRTSWSRSQVGMIWRFERINVAATPTRIVCFCSAMEVVLLVWVKPLAKANIANTAGVNVRGNMAWPSRSPYECSQNLGTDYKIPLCWTGSSALL